MSVFSQAAVFFLMLIIAVGFLTALRSGNNPDSVIGRFFHKNETLIARNSAMLYVDQLDSQTMKRIKRFAVEEVSANGILISRPNAKDGDIILKDVKGDEAAFTVSENHAVIAKDESGMFIQDNESRNGTFVMEDKRKIPLEYALNITDGLIVYLGEQPLRFSFQADEDDDEPLEESAPKGRRPMARSKNHVVRHRRR